MHARIDPLAAAALRRALPVLHLPDTLWPEVHPLSKRAAPRPEARQPAGQRGLRAEDL